MPLLPLRVEATKIRTTIWIFAKCPQSQSSGILVWTRPAQPFTSKDEPETQTSRDPHPLPQSQAVGGRSQENSQLRASLTIEGRPWKTNSRTPEHRMHLLEGDEFAFQRRLSWKAILQLLGRVRATALVFASAKMCELKEFGVLLQRDMYPHERLPSPSLFLHRAGSRELEACFGIGSLLVLVCRAL